MNELKLDLWISNLLHRMIQPTPVCWCACFCSHRVCTQIRQSLQSGAGYCLHMAYSCFESSQTAKGPLWFSSRSSSWALTEDMRPVMPGCCHPARTLPSLKGHSFHDPLTRWGQWSRSPNVHLWEERGGVVCQVFAIWQGRSLWAFSRSLLAKHVSSQFQFNLPAREMLFACLSLIIDVLLRSPVCAETETWCCNDKRLYFNFTVCHHCLSVAILLIPAAECHWRTHAKYRNNTSQAVR